MRARVHPTVFVAACALACAAWLTLRPDEPVRMAEKYMRAQAIASSFSGAVLIARHGRVGCIGGGVGTAELLPIARALRADGNELHAVVGARTRDLLILEREMAECAHTLALTTDDGSYGTKGVVTGPLLDLLRSPGLDAVYAIGPLPMMRAVAAATRPFAVKTYVSLNAIMLDGTGMCGGCRVSVDGQTRFACVDGPEFDGHAVDFDELMRRNASYADFERKADELWRERCAAREGAA